MSLFHSCRMPITQCITLAHTASDPGPHCSCRLPLCWHAQALQRLFNTAEPIQVSCVRIALTVIFLLTFSSLLCTLGVPLSPPPLIHMHFSTTSFSRVPLSAIHLLPLFFNIFGHIPAILFSSLGSILFGVMACVCICSCLVLSPTIGPSALVPLLK